MWKALQSHDAWTAWSRNIRPTRTKPPEFFLKIWVHRPFNAPPQNTNKSSHFNQFGLQSVLLRDTWHGAPTPIKDAIENPPHWDWETGDGLWWARRVEEKKKEEKNANLSQVKCGNWDAFILEESWRRGAGAPPFPLTSDLASTAILAHSQTLIISLMLCTRETERYVNQQLGEGTYGWSGVSGGYSA